MRVGSWARARGGGVAVGGGGGRNQLRKIAEKLRKIAGKLRKNAEKLQHCKQPCLTLKAQQFWTGGSDFSFQSYKKSWAAKLQEVPLNITMELEHEPKAADVVI